MYDDTPNAIVSEIVNLRSVDWMPCAKRAKRFVPIDRILKSLKKWKSSVKYFSSCEHSVKAYADYATLISNSL